MSSKRSGASPGGVPVSAAKRQRLAALDSVLSQPNRANAVNPTAPPPAVGAVPPRAPQAHPSDSSRRLGEFPYDPLGEAVLDGSLSVALARAKAETAAVAAAVAASGSNRNAASRVASGPQSSKRTVAGAAAAAATAAAAEAAASGNDSVAAGLLAQLLTTNPRASGDLRAVLTQRLQDKTVLLDNPLGRGGGQQSIARRGNGYSAKLRSKSQAKRGEPQPGGCHPSYKTMLRIHELWLQYAQSLAQPAAVGPAGSRGAVGGAGAAAGGGAGPVELVGALVTVVRHTNPQLVGATGIVLHRSSCCLHVVTPENRLRVVPLKGCTAHYSLNGRLIKLAG